MIIYRVVIIKSCSSSRQTELGREVEHVAFRCCKCSQEEVETKPELQTMTLDSSGRIMLLHINVCHQTDTLTCLPQLPHGAVFLLDDGLRLSTEQKNA